MLSFFDPARHHSRRDFLQVGGLALGGMTLPGLLSARAQAGESTQDKDKSVIFLFLHGGPSQYETFDPKMSAPQGIRSATGEIRTKLPGVTFGSSFPKLAGMADKLAIVRSFVTGDGNHDIKPIVGRDTFGANLGSVFARIKGANHPTTGLPTNVALFPRSVDPAAQGTNGVVNFPAFLGTGPFGAAYTPFDPSGGGTVINNMRMALPMNRLDDRRQLLQQLDRVQWSMSDERRIDALDRTQQQAFEIITRGVGDAFDLSKEDARVVARYDTAPLIRPENIDRKWKNFNNYVDNARSLGKLLLLARRLCERGCGFVTVTTNFVWDMHADVNNATLTEGMEYLGRPLDHALATFLEDLEARGLSEKILLVACGEMGRTPRINASGGRDHWGNIAPLLLAGGGLRMGQVIGRSTANGGEPQTEPMRIPNLLSTVLNSVVNMGDVRLIPGIPREIGQTMAGYEPIPGLLP